MDIRNRRKIHRQINQGENNRVWRVADVEEAKALSEFLGVCASKLAIAEMEDFHQSDLSRVFEEIKNGQVKLDDLKKLSANELHDLIIGQKRLFE